MGVQVILNQTHDLRVGVMLVEQGLHKRRVIHRRASFPDLDIAKPGMWFKRQEDTTRTVFLVLIVMTPGFAWTHRQDRPGLADQKTRALVEVNQGPLRIVRQLELRQHVLHVP